jgi:zinc-ribbon domain
MFCTACGTAIPAGQTACPQCGQPMAQAAPLAQPLIPPPALEVEQYRHHVRILAIAWFVYAGLSLLLGLAGLNLARHFLMGDFGQHMHGHMQQEWIPMVMHLGWAALLIRAGLALVTGWALLQQARWGRIFAIVIAILCLFRIPLGTALGIWTLVMLLGYRHTALYERLQVS